MYGIAVYFLVWRIEDRMGKTGANTKFQIQHGFVDEICVMNYMRNIEPLQASLQIAAHDGVQLPCFNGSNRFYLLHCRDSERANSGTCVQQGNFIFCLVKQLCHELRNIRGSHKLTELPLSAWIQLRVCFQADLVNFRICHFPYSPFSLSVVQMHANFPDASPERIRR